MKRQHRLRPVEALAGGGGRYRYREVRPDPKREHGNPKYLTLQGCAGCGYHVCSCPPAEPRADLERARRALISWARSLRWGHQHEADVAGYATSMRCPRCAESPSGRCSWHPAELPKRTEAGSGFTISIKSNLTPDATPSPDDGLVWEEVATVSTADGLFEGTTNDNLWWRMSTGRKKPQVGDTVTCNECGYVLGLNGEVFQ